MTMTEDKTEADKLFGFNANGKIFVFQREFYQERVCANQSGRENIVLQATANS